MSQPAVTATATLEFPQFPVSFWSEANDRIRLKPGGRLSQSYVSDDIQTNKVKVIVWRYDSWTREVVRTTTDLFRHAQTGHTMLADTEERCAFSEIESKQGTDRAYPMWRKVNYRERVLCTIKP